MSQSTNMNLIYVVSAGRPTRQKIIMNEWRFSIYSHNIISNYCYPWERGVGRQRWAFSIDPNNIFSHFRFTGILLAVKRWRFSVVLISKNFKRRRVKTQVFRMLMSDSKYLWPIWTNWLIRPYYVNAVNTPTFKIITCFLSKMFLLSQIVGICCF